MTEENTEEKIEEQVEEQTQEAPAEEGNSLFDALFTAADETPVEVEEEEPIEVPMSLTEAVDSLDNVPQVEDSTEEQEPEGEAEVVEEVKVEKSKPKKRKVRQVVDPEVEDEPQPEYSFPEEDPDKEFVDSLLPEERDIYETAKFASENLDGYSGKDSEFKDYFSKTKKYIEKRLSEDPHADLSNDEDYQAFISKNRPEFSQIDIKKVDRERNISEAMKRIEQKQAPEKERARVEQERAKKEPTVLRKKAEFRNYSVNSIPEELSEQIKDPESIQKFAETNPLEFQIVDNLTRELHNMGDTLLDITQNMVSYDESNTQHTRLLNWVNQEQEQYIKTGQTQHEGKTFMRRERYFRLPESKRTPYYTWSDGDLIAILTMRAKQRISESLGMQRDLLEKSGYARQAQAQAQAPKSKAPARRASPPSVNPTPRPGNTPDSAPKNTGKSAFETVLGL